MKNRMLLPSGLLLLALGAGAPAYAAAEVFAAGTAASAVIDDLRSAANDVINNGQFSVSRGSFEVRQNAEILLQQLNQMASQLGDKTFGQLSDAQRQFFVNTHVTLEEWKAGVNQTASKADQLIANADSMLGTLPFADRTARVVGYSPRYLAVASLNQPVHIRIRGSWLGSDEPKLQFDGKSCDRITKDESALEFMCALTPATADHVVASRGQLDVVDRQTLLDRFLGIFSNNKVHRKYELGIFQVPEKLGSAAVVATVQQEQDVTKTNTQTVRNDNAHCDGTRHYAWTLNATPGWSIAATPSVTLIGDGTATSEGVQGWTPSSFQISGYAKNSGSCVKVLGQTIAKDGRGHVEIRADWTEHHSELVESQAPVTVGELNWGNEINVPLPKGTKSLALTVSQIDGEKLIDTHDNSRGWYSVEVDTAASRLLIRPKPLEEALAD